MTVQKQVLNVNFAQGVDKKSDPYQIPIGKFETLSNSVFDVQGALSKRNGYKKLSQTPAPANYLTTFNDSLTALGSSIQSYSTATGTWVDKGAIRPVGVSTANAVRNAYYQYQVDYAVSDSGLACVVYSENNGVTNSFSYTILDAVSSQILATGSLPSADSTYGSPKVTILGDQFVILYTTQPASYQIVGFTISVLDPTQVSSNYIFAASYIPSLQGGFGILTTGSRVYLSYNTISGGQSIKTTYFTVNMIPVTPHTLVGAVGDIISLALSPNENELYITYYEVMSFQIRVAILNSNLNLLVAPLIAVNTQPANFTTIADNDKVRIFYQSVNQYGYDVLTRTDFISSATVTNAGVPSAPAPPFVRSVGLASQAFLYDGIAYFLGIYSSDFQPTYFLINETGQVVSILAPSNGGEYLVNGLPYISAVGSKVSIPYLYRESLKAVNKSQGLSAPAGVFSQLGIKIATFDLNPALPNTAEIGSNLNIGGGFLGAYDGVEFTEQGFFLYPDNVKAVAATGGSMGLQQYYYQATYEWTDNQGNLFRSAPSIPASVTLAGLNNAVTVNVPTLRLTYKDSNPVTIVLYRWSVAQPSYYQVTSVTQPIINDKSVDYITFTDTQPDSAIIGNTLVYTTGGVLENTATPAPGPLTLFNNRLWNIDAEDRNLLRFSQQVIQDTPVERSDLLSIYVSPTTGSEGSTGPMTAIAPMDDKLIVYKANALGYISGIGPDATGANNGYSDFTLITSAVGCEVQNSIVFIPQGLMFQSSKGIWLLDRNLSTNYIGAPVETFTASAKVLSAENIPDRNQVRFTLDNDITLLYDYYYGQWSTFSNIKAISSAIFEELHTYIDRFGRVFQETPGLYLDDSTPVTMSFTTGWINLAGIQGYQRFFDMLLLGRWYSPFTLDVQLSYDYSDGNTQQIIVTPEQIPSFWGGNSIYGGGAVWGDQGRRFEARVQPMIQNCESFKVSIKEVYDASYGPVYGQGIQLSAFTLQTGVRRGTRLSSAKRNFG